MQPHATSINVCEIHESVVDPPPLPLPSLAHYLHILVFTHSCTLPTSLVSALSIHTVRFTYSVACLRCRLERDPHTFSPSPQ